MEDESERLVRRGIDRSLSIELALQVAGIDLCCAAAAPQPILGPGSAVMFLRYVQLNLLL